MVPDLFHPDASCAQFFPCPTEILNKGFRTRLAPDLFRPDASCAPNFACTFHPDVCCAPNFRVPNGTFEQGDSDQINPGSFSPGPDYWKRRAPRRSSTPWREVNAQGVSTTFRKPLQTRAYKNCLDLRPGCSTALRKNRICRSGRARDHPEKGEFDICEM